MGIGGKYIKKINLGKIDLRKENITKHRKEGTK
jgi:hypothetical protein